MRLLPILLLLAAPIAAQYTLREVSVANLSVEEGSSLAPDESTTFIAVWYMEEASGNRASSGSCTTDCAMIEHGTITQDTTNKQQGTASASDTESTANYLDCANATCDEIMLSDSFTVGGWLRPSSSGGGSGYLLRAGNGTTGYQAGIDENNDALDCVVQTTTQSSANSTLTDDAWNHVACRWDNATDEIQPFIDGAASGSPGTQTTMTAWTSTAIAFGSTSNPLYGNIDEMFVIGQALSDAEICYICSCGIDNEQACACSGTSFASTGRRVSSCGSCTMPADCTDPIQ